VKNPSILVLTPNTVILRFTQDDDRTATGGASVILGLPKKPRILVFNTNAVIPSPAQRDQGRSQSEGERVQNDGAWALAFAGYGVYVAVSFIS
jgi:hypothetical protein